jgi:hypothetical protein
MFPKHINHWYCSQWGRRTYKEKLIKYYTNFFLQVWTILHDVIEKSSMQSFHKSSTFLYVLCDNVILQWLQKCLIHQKVQHFFISSFLQSLNSTWVLRSFDVIHYISFAFCFFSLKKETLFDKRGYFFLRNVILIFVI